MDAKTLAKSKRAHSQHHSKKYHVNVTSKAPSVGGNSGKNPSAKQVRDKPHQSQDSKLSSNWDRYEEDYDSGPEDPSRHNTSQATDVFMPKSKGADYGHLISDARSQSLTDTSSEGLPSFDDVLTDHNLGVGSLLSVRGQSILSRTRDDNFVVEDRATGNHEASFLSLNLHLLAEQLAKIDLSQMLFIDPEFLPPELFTEEFKISSIEETGELQAEFESRGEKNDSDELAASSYPEKDKTEDQVNEFMQSNSYNLLYSVSTSSNQGLNSSDQVENELNKSWGTSEIPVLYNRPQLDGASGTNSAEAELDMLLDTFSETKFLDSSVVTKNSTNSFSVQQQETSSATQVPNHISRIVSDLSKPANLNDALDDLLKETSSSDKYSILQQGTSTSLLGGIQSVPLAVAQLSRKDPDLPKPASVMARFDDALDDLLQETSNLAIQKVSPQSHEVIATHPNVMSSSSSVPVSKSKLDDDFDSWFDNIDGPP